MTRISRRRFVFAGFLCPLVLQAQETGILHLVPLHLELPATWRMDGTKRPIEGTGPNGEKMLVSPIRRPAGSGAPPVTEAARGFSARAMRDLAEKDGKIVVRPVQAFTAPEGKVGFSAGSERNFGQDRKSFFLQYLLANADAGFYITFEGTGDARTALEVFDRVMSTQRWDE